MLVVSAPLNHHDAEEKLKKKTLMEHMVRSAFFFVYALVVSAPLADAPKAEAPNPPGATKGLSTECFQHGFTDAGGVFGDVDIGFTQGFEFLGGGSFSATDDGTGVSHASAGRRG
jgi:hypothetical protein